MSRAGQPAEASDLVDIDELIAAYYDLKPDPAVAEQRVAFGTSGHRGSSLSTSFNEDHILATTQAIVDYRTAQGISGPLFLGRDTHGLSLPAERTAVEVLVANGVDVRTDSRDSWVPTPALSHAILTYNRDLAADDPARADGIVVTPRTTRRETGLQVQPAPRRPGRHRCHRLDRRPRQCPHRRRPRGRAAHAFKDIDADTLGSYDFRKATSPTSAASSTSPPSRRRACASARTPGRRLGRVLAADRRALRARSHRREPRGRPDVALHDTGLGREDPHGPVVAVRDGRTRGATP
jgi:phosphoglucomutase